VAAFFERNIVAERRCLLGKDSKRLSKIASLLLTAAVALLSIAAKQSLGAPRSSPTWHVSKTKMQDSAQQEGQQRQTQRIALPFNSEAEKPARGLFLRPTSSVRAFLFARSSGRLRSPPVFRF
jgi:hypothetical protein